MQKINVSTLALQDLVSANDSTVLTRFNFPIYAATGATGSAVVYFEIEPGKRLASHHDGAEEVLFIVQGEGIGTVGNQSGRVQAGDLVVIPAWVTHGVENTGNVTLKVVGFFGAATLSHVFAEPVLPMEGALTIHHHVDGESVFVSNPLQPAAV